MTQLLKKSLTVLLLMTLWLTSVPALGQDPSPPTPEATVVVPTSLLREATARIDKLELDNALLRNRATERDSLWAGEKAYWTGRLAYSEITCAQWEARYEKLSRSWWHQNKSALWLGVGVGLAAWALQ